MITADIRVNGNRIAFLDMVNKGDVGGGRCTYSCRYYVSGRGPASPKTFVVEHKRDEGAERLMAIAFEALAGSGALVERTGGPE